MTIKIFEVQPYLKNLAHKYTKSSLDAQDIVQETKVKAITKMHQFKPGTSFKDWTSTILRNTFISSYRQRKKLNMADLKVVEHQKDHTDDFDEIHLLEKRIHESKSGPSKDSFKILDLRNQGYPFEDIAYIMNLPLGTVKSKQHLAQKQFKNNYENLMK